MGQGMTRSIERARTGSLPRGLVAVVLVAGTLLATVPAAAGAADSHRSTADGLEWSVTWDGAVWDETDSGDAADLVLTGGRSTVSFLADVLYDGDASACVDGELGNATGSPGVQDSEALADLDLGDQDGDRRAYGGAAITTLDEDGVEQATATTVLCQTITPGESVLIVYHLVPLRDLSADEGAVADLVAGIVTGEGAADTGPRQTPTAEPAAATGADEGAGTYVSPSYGYGLDWNADDWEVEIDETLRTLGRDRLSLFASDAATRVYFEGSEEWDGDLDDCVSGLVEELVSDPEADGPIELASGDTISDIQGIDDPLTGDPFAATDRLASAGYTYHIEFEDGSDQDQFAIVDCVMLDEDSGLLLGVSQVGLADDLDGDIRQRVADITATVTYDGDPVEKGATADDALAGPAGPNRRAASAILRG